jgi:hypothetical protein
MGGEGKEVGRRSSEMGGVAEIKGAEVDKRERVVRRGRKWKELKWEPNVGRVGPEEETKQPAGREMDSARGRTRGVRHLP